MKIEITIKSCGDCRHLEHSGAFTPGGAKPVCGHSDAVKICGEGKKEPYHWKHRRVPGTLAIPPWCPLKRGSKY